MEPVVQQHDQTTTLSLTPNHRPEPAPTRNPVKHADTRDRRLTHAHRHPEHTQHISRDIKKPIGGSRLSDPQEDPAIRASKVIGISYASVMDKGTDPRYTTMRKKIEGWRSTAQKHKASKPDPAKILKEMLDSAYADDYTDQSRIVHPDLITMIDVMTAQNEGKPWNRQRAWNHSMCAMYATLIATERVATLRDANPDHIDQIAQIKQRFYEVAGLTDT